MPFIAPKPTSLAKIKVIGVGGGGQNAVGSMIESSRVKEVEFIAMNTDLQALNSSLAEIRVQLGPERTHGLGSGSDPELGRESAEESIEEIRSHLSGTDMVFITAGMGGGTGTGAAPVIAQAAREAGALTVGVVTKPFVFEGKRRASQAEQGIRELKGKVDALIVIPNEKILEVADSNMPLRDAFLVADRVVGRAVEGISDLITSTGLVNVDFADVKTVMKNAGSALMGIGEANGTARAEDAAKLAINSPLLDVDIKGSTGILINIVGDETLTMHEVNEAAKIISEAAHEAANIIFGASVDPAIDGIKVTVIATGFDSDFKTIAIPDGISDEDVLEQIDSRFDQKNENRSESKEEPEDYSIESDYDNEPNYESNQSDYDEDGGFDYEKMRQAVAEMERENANSQQKDEDEEEEGDDDRNKQGSFWQKFMNK